MENGGPQMGKGVGGWLGPCLEDVLGLELSVNPSGKPGPGRMQK